jgi:hypothetical protein
LNSSSLERAKISRQLGTAAAIRSAAEGDDAPNSRRATKISYALRPAAAFTQPRRQRKHLSVQFSG